MPACLLALLFTACGASTSAPGESRCANSPCAKVAPIGAPLHASWNDQLQIAKRVELPKLKAFWTGSVVPANTSGEPLLAVCVDKIGGYASRAKGADWLPQSDNDLLHTVRLFGEDSFNLDAQVSLCQVVIGADRNAPVSAVLGVIEMMSQARVARVFLATQESPSGTLLLDLSLDRPRPRNELRLALAQRADLVIVRLGDQTTVGSHWPAELEAIVGRVTSKPAALVIYASTLTMLEVEGALNGCWLLGMTSVYLQ